VLQKDQAAAGAVNNSSNRSGAAGGSVTALVLFCCAIAEFALYLDLGVERFSDLMLLSLLSIVCVFLLLKAFQPETLVYLYFAFWVIIPKSLYRIPGLITVESSTGSNLFLVFEVVILIALCLAFLTKGRTLSDAPVSRHMKRFFFIGFAAFMISLGSSIVLSLTYPIDALNVNSFKLLNGLIVLYACMLFITQRRQIERILYILLFAGFELVMEVVLIFYGGLDVLPTQAAFHWTGRFNSIIYNDYLMVGNFAVIALAATLYFIFAKRTHRVLVLLVPFLFLLATSGFERAVMVSMLIVTAVMIWFASSRRVKVFFGTLVFSTTLILLISPAGMNRQIDALENFLTSDVKPTQYFSGESIYSRVPNWARGIDVTISFFPFGVGPGNSPFFLSNTSVHEYFGSVDILGSLENAKVYADFKDTGVGTQAHNLYITLSEEFGLMGIVMQGYFVYLILGGIAHYGRFKGPDGKQGTEYFMKLSSYAVLAGFGFYYIVQNSPYILFVPLFFCHVGLLPTSNDMVNSNSARGERGPNDKRAPVMH
jgi:hypothetical protein